MSIYGAVIEPHGEKKAVPQCEAHARPIGTTISQMVASANLGAAGGRCHRSRSGRGRPDRRRPRIRLGAVDSTTGVRFRKTVPPSVHRLQQRMALAVRRLNVEYQMLSQESGKTYSFPVIFVMDLDGVWRLKAF